MAALFRTLSVRRRCARSLASDANGCFGLAPAEAWLRRRAPASWRERRPSWTSPALTVSRILLVVAAIGLIVVVIQAGHSGARAVWSDYPSLQP